MACPVRSSSLRLYRFEFFMPFRFPTIQDLAAVEDIEEVNALWKGLGYYRRASLLLKGAKKVVKDFDGHLPSDPKVLEKEVPGIGKYTAGKSLIPPNSFQLLKFRQQGAVTSISYNVHAPAVSLTVHFLCL